MKTKTYYEAVEKTSLGNASMLLDNPRSELEKVRWNRFASLESAKQRIEECKKQRKTQYFYFRDDKGNIVDKISFYERYNIQYKIYKVVEQEEVVYETNNDEVEIRQPKEHTQEETSL